MAGIYSQAELGQEACYQVLKENWANPTIKMAYFSLSTHYKAIYDKPFPETTGEGMVVRLSADGRKHILELTPEELQHNPIAQRVIGLHVNEFFEYTKPLTEETVTYSVEQILDKYQGQTALIAEELSTKPYNGVPVQLIEIPAGEDVELLLDRMKEVMGQHELKRQLLIDEAKRGFAEHKIGFLELVSISE